MQYKPEHLNYEKMKSKAKANLYAPDRYSKKLRIIARLRDGYIEPVDNQPLPSLKNGAVVTLLVDPIWIQNGKDREYLLSQERYEGLPSDTLVRFELRAVDLLRVHEKKLEVEVIEGHYFFYGRLLGPLQLIQRHDDKAPSCLSCNVRVKLGSESFKASSLNQALTRLSELFETKRQSHTGNVFRQVQFQCPKTTVWKKLGDLRNDQENFN